MSNARPRPQAETVPGIVDTLSAGFALVNRVPIVLIVPIALDLLLWLGPKLSVATLGNRLVTRLLALADEAGGVSGAEGQVEQFQQQLELLRGAAQTYNLLSLLAFGGFALESAVPPGRSGLGGAIELASGGQAIVLAILLLLLGVGLAAAWLGAIGQQVRDGHLWLPLLVMAVPRYWLRILGFCAMIIGGALAVTVPLMAIAAVSQLLVPALGVFLTLFVAVAMQLLVIWSLIYLFFFVDAIVVSEAGPIEAARKSVRVVATGFWSALGFIIITWVIMQGLHVIWRALAEAPLGLALAIVGNGYVESGLAAASMLFYRDRIARSTS